MCFVSCIGFIGTSWTGPQVPRWFHSGLSFSRRSAWFSGLFLSFLGTRGLASRYRDAVFFTTAVLHRSESGSFQALDVIDWHLGTVQPRMVTICLRYFLSFLLVINSYFALSVFVSYETSAPFWTILMYVVHRPGHLASGRALFLLHVQAHFPITGALVLNVLISLLRCQFYTIHSFEPSVETGNQ